MRFAMRHGFWLSLMLGLFVALTPRIIRLWAGAPRDTSSQSLPATYTHISPLSGFYKRIESSNSKPVYSPDTTAIILNWSRLPNVIRIASILCGPSLDDTIANVFIWNNSPQQLSQKDFSAAKCPPGKLKIHNSPSNLYFQARFIACTEATTPYCFIQDDDYLVGPEIIHTLRSHILDSFGIYLLPPHEFLSSQLRNIYVGSTIHTSFAWLGYGSMIHRFRAVEFLALMNHLNVTDEEMKMADNYYTILSNTFPDTWFDQGVELGGGQPFTVGTEGDNRNKWHTTRAARFLDLIMACGAPPCISNPVDALDIPYVNSVSNAPSFPFSRAPCRGSRCLLETSVNLLPQEITASAPAADHILRVEEHNLELLGKDKEDHYLKFPPSHAVDGSFETAFCGPQRAKTGDMVLLDMLHNTAPRWRDLEMVWLVDADTENILRACIFETSLDNVEWVTSRHQISCTGTALLVPGDEPQPLGATGSKNLGECSVRMLSNADDGARYFRAQLDANLEEKWCIYEVWLRGILN